MLMVWFQPLIIFILHLRVTYSCKIDRFYLFILCVFTEHGGDKTVPKFEQV